MPTYEYECENCNHHYEEFQSMTDKVHRKCPKCGKLKLHRLIGAGSGIIFKGTGFYETDYKNKKPSKSSESSETPKEKPAPKSEASTSTTKPKAES